MYTAFGPGSKDLRDPFEDHGAIRSQLKYDLYLYWDGKMIFHNYGLI
jgi:hypothetical protein